ncbi:putative trans-sialidase, partial [Trypanosoma cruzi]
ESEPQRPHMFRHLFYSVVLLFCVVVMCCASEDAHAEESNPVTAPTFAWKGITDENDVTVKSLGVPGLLKVGNDVFAVAEAHCKKNGEDIIFTGIASEFLAETKDVEQKEIMKDVKTKTQFLEKEDSEEKKVNVSRPTVVVEENDIYIMAGTYSSNPADSCQDGADVAPSGLLLVKGQVSDEESKKIDWNDTHALPCTFLNQEHKSWTQLTGGGGSGVKMEDGTLVFPVEATKKKTNQGDGNEKNGKTVSLIIYSKNTKFWKLSEGMSADGCSDPSVVEWEKDKLMMMTACDGGRRRVYESGDKGDSWTEALGTLSRVWGNKKGEKVEIVGSGFITATIDKKKVMLVTLPVYSSNDEVNRKGELHLWLTDNTHIVDIGSVSGEKEDVSASSLLYKSGESGDDNNEQGEELIALYERENGNEESSYGMFTVRLTAQLEKVKDVLKTWKEVDERVSQLCPTSTAAEDASPDTACSDGKITDGLVGFLSGNFSGNTWRDEYLGVNAIVNNKGVAKKADNGVQFTGRGAWAQWPVGKQGENQLYHFANYNFTLVATVSVHGEPTEGTIPLMGVKMDGDEEGSKLMELSYDSGKKWKLLCSGKTTTEHSSTLGTETTQHVVIMRRNGNQSSAYVNGKRLGGNEQCKLETTDSKEISHFYIVGDRGSADDTRSQEEL